MALQRIHPHAQRVRDAKGIRPPQQRDHTPAATRHELGHKRCLAHPRSATQQCHADTPTANRTQVLIEGGQRSTAPNEPTTRPAPHHTSPAHLQAPKPPQHTDKLSTPANEHRHRGTGQRPLPTGSHQDEAPPGFVEAGCLPATGSPPPTDLDIYFCDPHSPCQRASNENTNGLLRQYFPKGTDLSVHGAGYLDYVAAELNNRPRKRLNWRTPAEALQPLLSQPSNPPGVRPPPEPAETSLVNSCVTSILVSILE